MICQKHHTSKTESNNLSRKAIGILGATGSVGRSSFNVLKFHKDKFSVKYLVANSNVKLLAEQIFELKPEYVVLKDKFLQEELKLIVGDCDTKILFGQEGLKYVCSIRCDIVVSAIVGIAGLAPTIYAIEAGSNIALANKESLVCAGDLVMSLAKKHNVDIIPVDSEHSGLMQIFTRKKDLGKIILTASGGPFLKKTYEQMEKATISEALAHPTWKMGAKISIDSATLFNKVFEIVEASYLFELPLNMTDILIHPQSVIHALAYYLDGSVLAQMSVPNMEIPLHIALHWPERKYYPAEYLDLVEISKLDFFSPDAEKFRSLLYCKEILNKKQNVGLIVNCANEVAVEEFLLGHISLTKIYDIVEEVLVGAEIKKIENVDDALSQDEQIRFLTKEIIQKRY